MRVAGAHASLVELPDLGSTSSRPSREIGQATIAEVSIQAQAGALWLVPVAATAEAELSAGGCDLEKLRLFPTTSNSFNLPRTTASPSSLQDRAN